VVARSRTALALVGAVTSTALALAGCDGTTTVVTPATTTASPPGAGTAPATTQERPRMSPSTATRPPAAVAPDDTGGVLVERPGDFPNRGEAFILARLHPEIARRCTRADADSIAAGAVAGLACETEAAFDVAAFYDLFPTAVSAAGAYGRYRRANGVPLERGNCLAAGAGAASLPAEGAWRAGRALGAGRAMCFRAGERVWLVSSHPARVITYLSAPTRGPLAPFWRAAGAPTARPR
jgi:hypothetical protein